MKHSRAFSWVVDTCHPVTVDSLDHLHPCGTKHDNNHNPRFADRLKSLVSVPHPGLEVPVPSVLDIGCAGGAMVSDMWADGWDAIGIEGSDYSLLNRRAEWEYFAGECLFTADATKPYTISRQSEDGCFPARFNAVTAWEVLEHIQECDLPQFLANITRHLLPSGYFIVSIASYPSLWHEGGDESKPQTVDLHRTQKSGDWWEETLRSAGFMRDLAAEAHFGGEWVRDGSANFVLRRTTDAP